MQEKKTEKKKNIFGTILAHVFPHHRGVFLFLKYRPEKCQKARGGAYAIGAPRK
jgi:hypothetical protein